MAFDVQKTNIEITATDKTAAAFNSVKSSIGNLTSQFGALTGLLGAGAFVAFTKRIIDQADSMNDLSKRTGIAVGQLSAWQLATEQSGTSMEALTTALSKGSKYLVQHSDDLKKIGINAKTSEELVLQLSGVISKMSADDPRRVALAMQVLGKSAGELIPLLSEGEDVLRKQLDTANKWNKLTPEMAKNADAFNDKLAEFNFRAGQVGTSIVSGMLPPMTKLLEIIGRGSELTSTWTDKLKSIGLFLGPLFSIPALNEAFSKTPEQRGIAQSGKIRPANPAQLNQSALDDFLGGSGAAPKKDTIAERIKALGIENNLLAQGVPLEDARTIARLKGDGATDKQIVTILNATAVQNKYQESEKAAEQVKKDLIKATEDHAEAMRKMLETADEAVVNAQREYEESNRNLQVMQLGESALIRMEAARLQEAAASAEQGLAYARLNGLSQENIDFTETQILKLRQLSEARLKLADSADATKAFEQEKERIKDLEKEQKDSAKRVADQQKRFYDDLENALTDSLFNGFKKGESFAKAFGRNLIAFAKTWVLQPVIKAIFSPITGGGGLAALFGGSAQAAETLTGTGGSSIFGQLSSIGDIFQSGNASLISGIESLGTFLSTGTGGLGDMLGGALGQYAGEIANVLPFAGAAFNLLSGNINGAIGSAIGAALSFTPLGPVGGLIGGALGSALGGLFGGSSLPPRVTAQRFSSFQGGKFTPTQGVYQGDPIAGADPILDSINERFARNLSTIFSAYGLDPLITSQSRFSKKKKPVGHFDAHIDGKGAGFYTEKFGKDTDFNTVINAIANKALGEFSALAIRQSELPAGVKKFFDGLVKKEDVTEAINTLVGLKSALVDLPPVFDAIRNAIDTTAYKTSVADLKTRFSAVQTYTSLFYTQQEQFDTFTKQITRQFDALGKTLPETREGFRALVDGITVTDKTTSDLFNGLVALAPAADAYYKSLLEQKGALQAISTDLFSNASDYAYASVLAGRGMSYTPQIGEISTVNRVGSADLNATVQSLAAAQATTQVLLEAVVKAVQESARIQKIWNGDGMPETRVI